MKIDFFEVIKKTARGLLQIIKADLIASLINFIVLVIGLGYGGIPLYGLVAFLIAFVDLLPILGAGIVLIPWALIVLIMGNWQLALLLIILYLITLIINQIVQPIILGKSIGLKPLYTLLITIASMIIIGPVAGAIVGSVLSVLVAVILEIKETYEMENPQFKKDFYNKDDFESGDHDFCFDEDDFFDEDMDDEDLINL